MGFEADETVELVYRPGSARLGEDIEPGWGPLTFNRGDTLKTCWIQLVNDDRPEMEETFDLELVPMSGGGVVGYRRTYTIVDDDRGVFFSNPGSPPLDQVNLWVDESGLPSAVYLNRTEPSSETASIGLVVTEDGAGAGLDYEPIESTVVFLPGETMKRVWIRPIDNSFIQPSPRRLDLAIDVARTEGWTGINGAHVQLVDDESGYFFASGLYSLPLFVDVDSDEVNVPVGRSGGKTSHPGFVQLAIGPGVFGPDGKAQDFNMVSVRFDKENEKDVVFKDVTRRFGIGIPLHVTMFQTNQAGTVFVLQTRGPLWRLRQDEVPCGSIFSAFPCTDVAAIDIGHGPAARETNGIVSVYVYRYYSTAPVPVHFTVSTPGLDHRVRAQAVEVTFLPGDPTSKRLDFVIADDSVRNDNNSIWFSISNLSPENVFILRRHVDFSVDDDEDDEDVKPGYTIAGPEELAFGEEAQFAEVPVHRDGNLRVSSSVQYTIGAGNIGAPPTAPVRPGVDFAPFSGILEFGPEDKVRTIRIPLIDNSIVDGDRSIVVQLKTATTNVPILSGTTVVTLRDNESSRMLVDDFDPLSFLPRDVSPQPETFATCIDQSKDGTLYVARDAQLDGRLPGARINRFRPSGDLDRNFHSALIEPDVSAIRALPDGRLLVVSGPTTPWFRVDGVSRLALARLNPDGTLDKTFVPAVAGNNRILQLSRAADDSLFALSGDATHQALFHLHSDGTLDAHFAVVEFPAHRLGDLADLGSPSVAFNSADPTLPPLRFSPSGEDSGWWKGAPDARVLIGTPDGGLVLRNPDKSIRFVEAAGANELDAITLFDPTTRKEIEMPLAAIDNLHRVVFVSTRSDAPAFFIKDPKRPAPVGGPATARLGSARALWQYGTILQVVPQPDGSLIVAGVFESIEGLPRRGIAKIWHPSTTLPVALDPDSNRLPETAGHTNIVLVRQGRSDSNLTIHWQTADASARSNVDYVGGDGSLSFLPNETKKAIPVEILDNSLPNSRRSFYVRLTGVSPIPTREQTYEVLIVDDDPGIAPEDFAVTDKGDIRIRVNSLNESDMARRLEATTNMVDWIPTDVSISAWIGAGVKSSYPRDQLVYPSIPTSSPAHFFRLAPLPPRKPE